MHRIMRQALVDHARKRDADRRPQIEYVSPDAIELYDIPATLKEHPEQIIALEDALERLTKEDAELADIIEFHYFSGINVAEIANLLEVSESTIKRNLKRARMVLYKYILEFLNGTD
jgi:RNA polymerase sigma factor (sigma-70 family)